MSTPPNPHYPSTYPCVPFNMANPAPQPFNAAAIAAHLHGMGDELPGVRTFSICHKRMHVYCVD
jgi:hypothetical protein